MTRGVCYFLCGGGKRQKWRRYVAPLMVSLYSLRKHYDGPVCILVGDDLALGDDFPHEALGDLWRRVPITPVRRHSAYVTKSSLWRHAPFDQTVLLDADTLCTGDIGELFEAPLTVTRFSNWVTTGGLVGGRLRQWKERGIMSDRVTALTSFSEPAINTGVVGWNRDTASTELEAWERLTQQGCECSFTDELAMQLLWPDFCRGRMLDDSFNCSPSFGINREDARVWHFHGRRMAPGRGKPDCTARYRPHLLEALAANTGGIRDWIQDVDPALADLAK